MKYQLSSIGGNMIFLYRGNFTPLFIVIIQPNKWA